MRRRDVLVGNRAIAAEQRVDHALAVERIADRLAHVLVGEEGIAVVGGLQVEVEVLPGGRIAGQDAQAGVSGDRLQLIAREAGRACCRPPAPRRGSRAMAQRLAARWAENG